MKIAFAVAALVLVAAVGCAAVPNRKLDALLVEINSLAEQNPASASASAGMRHRCFVTGICLQHPLLVRMNESAPESLLVLRAPSTKSTLRGVFVSALICFGLHVSFRRMRVHTVAAIYQHRC